MLTKPGTLSKINPLIDLQKFIKPFTGNSVKAEECFLSRAFCAGDYSTALRINFMKKRGAALTRSVRGEGI